MKTVLNLSTLAYFKFFLMFLVANFHENILSIYLYYNNV